MQEAWTGDDCRSVAVSFADRQYQTDSVSACETLMAQKSGAVLLVLPTGTGKTRVASSIIHNRIQASADKPIFLAPRREIVYQTAQALRRMDLDPAIMMAGHEYFARKTSHVASVDTLRSWVKRGRIELRPGGLLVVDEAHGAISPTLQWIIDAYQDAGSDVLGLTATPIRADGRGMKPTFQHLHVGLTMTRAVLDGWLVKPDYRIANVPDLSGVSVGSGGEFNQTQLNRVMSKGQLIGDIVSNWVRHAEGMPTLAFTAGVDHSLAVVEAFKSIGVRAAHIDGNTDPDTRASVLRAMEAGELDLISNCAVFTEGTDIPRIACIIDAQPTKSLGRHIQKMGRGLRTIYEPGMALDTAEDRLAAIAASSKTRCLILDNAGNFYRHGRIDRNFPWALCEGKEVIEAARRKIEKAKVTFTCDECGKVFGGQLYCPECGWRIEIKGKMKDYVEADLVSMTGAEFANIENTITENDKRRFYLEVLHWCREPAKKKRVTDAPRPRRDDKFASVMFKQKFGEWPPWAWLDLETVKTSVETASYIRSRNIAYAKAKQKEAAT